MYTPTLYIKTLCLFIIIHLRLLCCKTIRLQTVDILGSFSLHVCARIANIWSTIRKKPILILTDGAGRCNHWGLSIRSASCRISNRTQKQRMDGKQGQYIKLMFWTVVTSKIFFYSYNYCRYWILLVISYPRWTNINDRKIPNFFHISCRLFRLFRVTRGYSVVVKLINNSQVVSARITVCHTLLCNVSSCGYSALPCAIWRKDKVKELLYNRWRDSETGTNLISDKKDFDANRLDNANDYIDQPIN